MTPNGRRVWRTLTKRERQVVTLLCVHGEGSVKLADQLGIQPSTVAHHLTQLYDKTGMDTRVGLIIFAFNHGWIMPEWAVKS